MTNNTPHLIEGALSIDDRGQISFVNDFQFKDVKRFYLVENHRPGFIRAWHGHKKEAKYVIAVAGSALVCAVRIDDWDSPARDIEGKRTHSHVLSAGKPSVLYIPPGYANGWKSLTSDAKLMFFSTATLEESQQDDIRFPAKYWNPWDVKER
jgi:dTDP-4-dehydrorhamnose 3,5-epimerase-like enzyme